MTVCFSYGYGMSKSVEDALHELVRAIESLIDMDQLDKFARNKNHEDEPTEGIADEAVDETAADTHSRFPRLRNLKYKALKHLYNATLGPVGGLHKYLDPHILAAEFPQASIFKHISPDACEEVTSKILALNTELERKFRPEKLPDGYWYMPKTLRSDIFHPETWDSTRPWNFGLGDSFKPEGRVLLVTGEPGCGKTNLLLHIAKRLQRQKCSVESNDYFVVTHFSHDESTIQDCLSSLYRQFHDTVIRHPEHKPRVQDGSFGEVKINMLAVCAARQDSAIYVILDDLDKYGSSGSAKLLELISSTCDISPNIHWIISVTPSSNSYGAIATRNFTRIDITDVVLAPLTKNLVSMQVDKFFKSTDIPISARDNFETTLLDISKGSPLWITIACSVMEKDPKIALALASHGQDLYARVYEQQKLTVEENVYLEEITTTMATAYRPLAISELHSLVALPRVGNLRKLIEQRFLPFLEIRGGIVCFANKLAEKYLIKQFVVLVVPETHAKLALQCLRMFAPNSDSIGVFLENKTHYALSQWIKHFSSSYHASKDSDATRKGFDAALMNMLSLVFDQWFNITNKIGCSLSDVRDNLLQLRNLLIGIDGDLNDPQERIIADMKNAVQLDRFNHSVDAASPKDGLLFYPYKAFRSDFLKKAFQRLLNVPETEYDLNEKALNIHPNKPTCCAFSLNGRFLASCSWNSHTVYIWDVSTGAQVGKLEASDSSDTTVRYIAFSVNGLLATLTLHGIIDVWDFPKRQLIKTIRKEEVQAKDKETNFEDLTFSLDGKYLATVMGERIMIWTLPLFEEHSCSYPLSPKKSTNRFVRLLGGKEVAITSGTDVHILDWETRRVIHTLHSHTPVTSLAFSPKHQWLASGSGNDDTINIWDSKSGKLLDAFIGHEGRVTSISFSFDETKLASGSQDKTIKIWDLTGWNLRQGTHGYLTVNRGPKPLSFTVKKAENDWPCENIESVVFSPNDLSLASASSHGGEGVRGQEGTVRIWDGNFFQHEIHDSVTLKDRHTCAIHCLKYSHKGTFFATASRDGKINIWDGNTGEHRVSLASGGCKLLSISPDEESLASSSADSTVMIWNAEAGSLRQQLIGHRDEVLCAEFSPDGRYLATASKDTRIGIWDLRALSSRNKNTETEQPRWINSGSSTPRCLAYSPDGAQLAFTGDFGTVIQIWNLKSNDPQNALKELQHEERYRSEKIFFSKDREFIIASGPDHLSLWNVQSQQRIRTIRNVPIVFQSLIWSKKYPNIVYTDLGSYSIGNAFDIAAGEGAKQPDESSREWLELQSAPEGKCLYRLKLDGSGITWKDECLTEFPKRYRPHLLSKTLMASVHRTNIAIGCESGLVTFFKFAEDNNEKLF
ncbi:hypothetical protein GGI35DRAFT_489042 [Trichoderma velutinum]